MHVVRPLGVQGRRGLVEVDHRGVGRERPRNGDALLLTAREFVRIGVVATFQADPGEKHPGALARRLGLHAVPDDRTERHVLEHRMVEKEVVVLKDEGRALAKRGPFPSREPSQVVVRPLEREAAGVGRLESVQTTQQRRLSRAARPDHGDDLSLSGVETHAVEHLGRTEGFVKILQVKHGSLSAFRKYAGVSRRNSAPW